MSECQKCNQKPTSKSQYITIILGLYLLCAAIYGSIIIVQNIVSFFR